MKISFCQTSKNRLYQFKETVFTNLKAIKNDINSELVLVNYDDHELEIFAKNYLQEWIDNKYFVYLRLYDMPYFEVSKAKNIAHFTAKGDFVFNLDCDNFLDNEINAYRSIWETYPDAVIHGLSKGVNAGYDGSYGRIGLSKNIFNYFGGYDEDILGVSEDTDLIRRCLRFNMPYARVLGNNQRAIQNSRKDTVENVKGSPTFEDCFIKNKALSLKKLQEHGVIRNKERQKVKVIKNFDKEIEV